jgi:glycosyltransferase involved in cell wall biosynthesis
MHGLLTALARRHQVTAVCLADPEFDLEDCERAMRAYCHEVKLLPNPRGRNGMVKRALQLRSLASSHSFEYHRYGLPALQRTIDGLLTRTRFDLVNVEFPYQGWLHVRQSPAGTPPPPLVIDAHEIAYDIARQLSSGGLGRSLYGALNWRKLRREELRAFREADGVCLCSEDDQRRLLQQVSSARSAVVPNAADVEHYQPRDTDPPPDGRTVVFFGLLSTVPNIDGVRWLVREIWPRVVSLRPDARLKILGKNAGPAVRALAGPGVEVTGFVEDLRPHLASAAAVVVPLRLGGGTRLKIVEGMAMAKAIVSTTLGAEGIAVHPGRDILIADEPERFATEVAGLLAEPEAARRIGAAARRLAVERYAWSSAARALEELYLDVLGSRSREEVRA